MITMFTTLPFVVISLFFTLFGILLTTALGSLLSIYAASSSGKHVNSIRWTRQGGYLEMISSLRQYFSLTMLLTILGSIICLFASVILSQTVTQGIEIDINPSTFVSKTRQVSSFLANADTWTGFRGLNSSIDDTLGMMLNDSQYINNFDGTKNRYIPMTYPFDIDCQQFDVGVLHGYDSRGIVNGGCAGLGFELSRDQFLNWNLNLSTYTRLSESRFSVLSTGTITDTFFTVLNPDIMVILDSTNSDGGQGCYLPTFDVNVFNQFPKSGMVVPPMTKIFKCFFPSGQAQVVSETKFNFAIRTISDFKTIMETIFDDPNQLPLLGAMLPHTTDLTFWNTTTNSTMLMFVDNTGPLVHYFSCNSVWMTIPTDAALLCSYIVADVVITKLMPLDSDLLTASGPQASKPTAANYNYNEIHINHFPAGYRTDPVIANSSTTTGDGSGGTTTVFFGVADILNATTAGNRYMTSLGQNVLMDQTNQWVYIRYITVQRQFGTQFPAVVLWVMVVIMVLCVMVSGFTAWRYDYRFTGSLYGLIYEQLESTPQERQPESRKWKSVGPSLVKCSLEPLIIDDVPVLQE